MAWQGTLIRSRPGRIYGRTEEKHQYTEKAAASSDENEGRLEQINSTMEVAGLITTEATLSVSNSPFKGRSIGMMGGTEREEKEAVHEA